MSPNRVTTWADVAAYVTHVYPVQHEWPGQGFAIVLNGMAANHPVLIAIENPGYLGVDHVTIQATLGRTEEVDVLAAAKAAGSIPMAGIVWREDAVLMRISRALPTLTLDHLAATIGSFSGALDGYVMIRGH
jgi:hypothetical protein